ncbi:MAG: hypothetical protein HDQ93_06105 [Desulfovibrio sp.]|nr:hypothetical protein [Desulfovibrio sp.]
MKKIPEPNLASAAPLSPAELNKIHFGGNHTPLTPEQLRALAEGKSAQPASGDAQK